MKNLLLLFILVFAVSCGSREDEPTPKPPKYVKSDAEGTWKMTQWSSYINSWTWVQELNNRTLTLKPDNTFTTYRFPQDVSVNYTGSYTFKNEIVDFDQSTMSQDWDMVMVFDSKTTATVNLYAMPSHTLTNKYKIVKQ